MSLFREKPPEPAAASREPSALQVDGSTQYLTVSLPNRDSVVYPELLAIVKDAGFQLEPTNRKWWLRDRHKVLTFLARHLQDFREKYRAQFTPGFNQRTTQLQFAKLTATAGGREGAFEVGIELTAPGADEEALRGAVARGQAYIETSRGLILVNPNSAQKLAEAQRALGGPSGGGAPLARFRRSVTAAELPALESLLESLAVPFETPATWKTRSEALRKLDRLAPAPMDAELSVRLR